MLTKILRRLLIVSLMLALPQQQAIAQESDLDDILGGFDVPESSPGTDTDIDDVLSDFDDEPTDIAPGRYGERQNVILPDWCTLSGGIGLSAAYNFAHQAPLLGQTDHRNISKLRANIDIQADLKFSKLWQARIAGKSFYDSIYSLRGRDEYTQQTLDEYEDEAEISEMYLQGMLLPNLDFKVGRQIVVWGKSDNIRVTDILNPLDNREPGVVDIRDLRLPVTMSKLDYYQGSWGFNAIIVNEVRFNKNPVFGNDFYGQNGPQPPEIKPSTSLSNQEFALAANGIFSGWDISFYGAHLFDDQSHRVIDPAGKRLEHSRINMLGSAINVAQGNWLLKGEAAFLSGLEQSIEVGKKDRFDLLLGAEYTGINETILSIELVNRHLFAFDERLRQAPVYGQENEFQSVLRYSRDFLHDTLRLTVLLSTFGINGSDGSFQRVSSTYDWSDSIAISGGIILYQDGDKALFRNIGNNDRIFTEIRYSF